jgi:hypothetical protein
MTIEVAELRHSRTLILPMSRGVIEVKRSASDVVGAPPPPWLSDEEEFADHVLMGSDQALFRRDAYPGISASIRREIPAASAPRLPSRLSDDQNGN